MWLARPVYESLPYAYIGIGDAALALSYVQSPGRQSVLSFALGCAAIIGGLTLFLHRQDSRRRMHDYPGDALGDPPAG
jgi:hypothetical protein